MSRPYALMIDPGHGGKDPGAVNERLRVNEKDIVLAVGLLTRRCAIRGDYLYMPYMTRDEDVFVGLQERCEKAKFQEVQAFLSIHTNARPARGKYGLEIEAWCYRGSKRGRGLAQTMIDYLSIHLSELIPFYSRGVKEGGFYVLRKTPMPAVLVELGFLSDNEEAVFLQDKDTQKKMALALAEGAEYFLEGGDL